MNLKDLDEVGELKRELEGWRRTLSAFEGAKGDTVPVQARVGSLDYGRGATVDLLPVPKQVAVSAAQRAVSKVIDQLRNLGVEVTDPEEDAAFAAAIQFETQRPEIHDAIKRGD